MLARSIMDNENTLLLTVANTGFLLDRLGEDCHPLQFLRELTKNGIEAILRTPQKIGEVVWDVDWQSYDLSGVYKLSVTDNGDGMTGSDMAKYINQLSSSGSEQSFIGNYGVGAKISAATRNHEGMVYLSWRDGTGAMAHLWKDPTNQQYGLRQIERPDGTYGHFAEVSDVVKPEMISTSGTRVVLLGNTLDQDTMAAPAGAPSPSRWIAKYLNARFFRFPDGISVRVREGWTNPLMDRDRNLLRTVTGQESYLDKHMESKGSVSLKTATAHWWILKDESALDKNSGYIESAGHIAALHKEELYELLNARAGMTVLQQFGIIFGYKRVVLYIEPGAAEGNLTTNTARTQLLIDNRPLPWADWAAEFRANIPKEIEQLINNIASNASNTDHQDSIRERLKSIMDLYLVSKYRASPKGSSELDISSYTSGGVPQTDQGKQRIERSSSGTKGGKAGGVYANYLKDGGPPGEQITPDSFPKVEWVSIGDNTRERGMIEDRAAKYLQEQNRLLINKDFRVFEDMIDKFCKDYKDNEAFRGVIADTVHAWFEQSLVETVLGVQALANSQEWTSGNIADALSEEALTSAVMPRYHVHVAIRRELGAKLGTTKVA
jgi:hypothetical protein